MVVDLIPGAVTPNSLALAVVGGAESGPAVVNSTAYRGVRGLRYFSALDSINPV